MLMGVSCSISLDYSPFRYFAAPLMCILHLTRLRRRAYGDVQYTFRAPETIEAQQSRLFQWCSITLLLSLNLLLVAVGRTLKPLSVRIQHMEKVHADDTIVVCTHGGCMMVLEAVLTGTSALLLEFVSSIIFLTALMFRCFWPLLLLAVALSCLQHHFAYARYTVI
jgi:hypothetical protein